MRPSRVFERVNPGFKGITFLNDFQIFGLEIVPLQPSQLNQLESESDVNAFIIKHSSGLNNFGIIRMLYSRHREHLQREISPAFPAYSNSSIALLHDHFGIPSTYHQFRTYANATGCFQKYVKRAKDGAVEHVSFVLRVPHSPRHIKSIWSLGLAWYPSSGVTHTVWDGVPDFDIRLLLDYLTDASTTIDHPLTLPVLIMDILSHYKTADRNRLERVLYGLEMRLGVTRRQPALLISQGLRAAETLDYDTMQCNQLVTSLIYQERHYTFLKELADDIVKDLELSRYHDLPAAKQHHDHLSLAALELYDIAQNCSRRSKAELHQNSCLQKRARTLLDVIYIMVAQRDSQATMAIATAAKLDSSAMTAIAVLTMFFLPATFVSSFFGMNLFQYTSGGLSTSNSFWLFWCTSIPLTILVLAGYLGWVFKSRHSDVAIQKQFYRPPSAEVPDLRANLLVGGAEPLEHLGPVRRRM